MIKPILIAATVLAAAAGCAQVTETVLNARGKATDKVVDQTIEGARLYCATTPAAERARIRARTNVAGKGPVISIDCEAFGP